MSAKKLTQEEKVLLAILRTHKQAAIDTICKQLGLNDKSGRHAVHLLLHGNCIVKAGDDAVRITDHGKKVCEHLLSDQT